MRTIRLFMDKSNAPEDHFDVVVKPFDQLTVADHIRIFESDVKGETEKERLVRVTGAPTRFIRAMSMDQVEEAFRVIAEQTRENDRTLTAFHKAKETLSKWPEEHQGASFTVEDAKAVLEDHQLFRSEVTVKGHTYTAPLVEHAAYGKWLDLQEAMDLHAEHKGPESESYVKALSIMMDGEDGPYPVQGEHESDGAYMGRASAYTSNRQSLFMEAKWIDVMGAAAFFFSRYQRFATLCAHNMRSFQSLLPHGSEPERTVIPRNGLVI